MKTTVRWRGTKEQLRALLYKLPGICSGRERDRGGIGRSFRLIVVVTVLEKIREAYLAKSDGGTDELGNKWKKLKPATIAAREPPPHKRRGERPRGLLTEGQDRIWRGIYARLVSRGVSEAEAAQRAWAIVKSLGGKTRLAEYGKRKVPILRVSDRLLESVSPGKFFIGANSYYYAPAEQRIDIDRPGRVEMTTKVPYAGQQHATRPLWPKERQMRPWIVAAAERGMRVIANLLGSIVR